LIELGRQILNFTGFGTVVKIGNKKKLLAKLFCGKFSPIPYLLPEHKHKFPAILTYHRVIAVPNDYPMTRSVINCTPSEFDEQLDFLSQNYYVTNFREIEAILDRGDVIPENSLIITFDDGYFDNFAFALPLLKKYGMTATVFISTSYVDTGNPFWVDLLAFQIFTMPIGTIEILNGEHSYDVTEGNRNDVRVAIGRLCSTITPVMKERVLTDVAYQTGIYEIPENYMKLCRPMTWDEVRHLDDAGIEIGAHSVSHGFLTQYDDENLLVELVESKRQLEKQLGRPIISMAYPAGNHDDRVVQAAGSAGYKFCCIFDNGIVAPSHSPDLLRLSRLVVDNHVPISLFRAYLKYPKIFVTP